MDLVKQEPNINELVEKLIRHGENKQELNFWQGMYDELDREDKAKLLLNLVKELEDLERVQGVK